MSQTKYILTAMLALCFCAGGYLFTSKLTEREWSIVMDDTPGTCGVVSATFAYSPSGIDGKAVFQSKCQSCHSLHKAMTGPPLSGIIMNPFWADSGKIARYLRDPLSLRKDTYIKTLRVQYGSEQMAFPEITDEQVAAIVEYLDASSAY